MNERRSLSRLALAASAVVLGVAMTGCGGGPADPAPDATQRVAIDGVVTEVAASGGGRSYVLDVAGQGFLPLELGDRKPPSMATGVVVEVPDSVEVPDGAEGRFEALNHYIEETGQSLPVVDYLP